MVMVVLMQIAGLYFLWKKSNAATENVRRGDLTLLKKELKGEIKSSEERSEKRCDKLDEDLVKIREDSEKWRGGVDEKLSKIEAATSRDSGANSEAMEFIKQKLISLDGKVEKLADRKADKADRKHNHEG